MADHCARTLNHSVRVDLIAATMNADGSVAAAARLHSHLRADEVNLFNVAAGAAVHDARSDDDKVVLQETCVRHGDGGNVSACIRCT